MTSLPPALPQPVAAKPQTNGRASGSPGQGLTPNGRQKMAVPFGLMLQMAGGQPAPSLTPPAVEKVLAPPTGVTVDVAGLPVPVGVWPEGDGELPAGAGMDVTEEPVDEVIALRPDHTTPLAEQEQLPALHNQASAEPSTRKLPHSENAQVMRTVPVVMFSTEPGKAGPVEVQSLRAEIVQPRTGDSRKHASESSSALPTVENIVGKDGKQVLLDGAGGSGRIVDVTGKQAIIVAAKVVSSSETASTGEVLAAGQVSERPIAANGLKPLPVAEVTGQVRQVAQPGVDLPGAGQVRRVIIQLEPAYLGSVTIHLSRTPQGLDVRMVAEQALAAEALRVDSSALARVLRLAGAVPDSVTVQIVEAERPAASAASPVPAIATPGLAGMDGQGQGGILSSDDRQARSDGRQQTGREGPAFGADSDDNEARMRGGDEPDAVYV